MTQKELKKEETELAEAVRVLRATLRGIAQRKARRYEIEFMHRVRDMIDREIGEQAELNGYLADYTGNSVKKEIMKN